MKLLTLWLIAAVLALTGCAAHEEEVSKPVVDVKVVRATAEDVQITVSAPASVFARELANVASRVTAPIRKLAVRKGDTVAAGQVLAQLDSRDALAQRDEAVAAVADADAGLQRLTAATIPTDIERARGQYASAEAALNQAQKFYDRRKQLFEQGAIPQRDLLQSQTDLAVAKTSVEVARKSLDLMQNQSRERDIAMGKAKLAQARAHLGALQAQLDFSEIRSPFAGSVTEQFMFPGDMAKPDLPIFTVMDLSVAVARAQVPESDATAVKRDAACSFLPSDSETSVSGRVSVVNQAVDPARRTVEIWCEIANGKGALRAGVFGHVTIITSTVAKGVVVPAAAVQFDEGANKGSVFIAGPKSTAVKREVVTGEKFDGKVQVISGLAAGETVIVQGGYGLPDGTQIRVQGDEKK